ncbi:chemotaxis protein CheR [Sagittula sp. NFXS13]|nr:CheR family methyltransferase [Sagittula marina]
MATSVATAETSSDKRFERFSQIVKDEIGVRLPQNKRVMVESRLRRRMTELRLASVDQYFTYLFDEGALEGELDVIFDAVTTNKTDFFREAEHFRLLAGTILPDRLKRRPATGRASMFKIWSAAASSGMEAYTAAMVLADYATRHGAFEWGILGTDINLKVLDRARAAVYNQAEIAPVPAANQAHHLMEGIGRRKGEWRVVPELRRRVQFQQINLLSHDCPIDRNIDVIFLRNVLIYFDARDQAKVISRMVDHLAPRGHLFVGHSESMIVSQPSLTQIAPAVFCKD